MAFSPNLHDCCRLLLNLYWQLKVRVELTLRVFEAKARPERVAKSARLSAEKKAIVNRCSTSSSKSKTSNGDAVMRCGDGEDAKSSLTNSSTSLNWKKRGLVGAESSKNQRLRCSAHCVQCLPRTRNRATAALSRLGVRHAFPLSDLQRPPK